MGDTKTSNGVSKNGNAKKKNELGVQHNAEIIEDIHKFTGDPDKTINANCTTFEINQRELDENTGSAGSSDETATTANTTIEASNPITQTLANVELAGVYVKVYDLENEKDKDSKSKKGKENSEREDVDQEK